MKTQLTKRLAQNAVLVFLGALIISSCATTSISKRRYTGGFNLEFSFLHKKKTNNHNSINVAKANAHIVKANDAKNETKTLELKVVKSLSNEVAIDKVSKISYKKEVLSTKNNSNKTLSIPKNSTPIVKYKIANKAAFLLAKHAIGSATKNTSESGDLSTLIYIIIALFIPPLAVLLFEGSITKNFWITLLLFLLGIYGFLYLHKLLVTVAIIYAILVILGMI